MARTSGKRGREETETYDSDGGFVSNDDSAPKKKSKKGQAASKSKADDGDGEFWELSSGRNPRRVAIQDFKKAKLIGIREYYEKDGEFLPAKKGISLTIEQYQAFLKAIPKINSELKAMGIDVSSDSKDEDEDDSMGEVEKPKKRVKAKKDTKANIEATSDEDEDEE